MNFSNFKIVRQLSKWIDTVKEKASVPRIDSMYDSRKKGKLTKAEVSRKKIAKDIFKQEDKREELGNDTI